MSTTTLSVFKECAFWKERLNEELRSEERQHHSSHYFKTTQLPDTKQKTEGRCRRTLTVLQNTHRHAESSTQVRHVQMFLQVMSTLSSATTLNGKNLASSSRKLLKYQLHIFQHLTLCTICVPMNYFLSESISSWKWATPARADSQEVLSARSTRSNTSKKSSKKRSTSPRRRSASGTTPQHKCANKS